MTPIQPTVPTAPPTVEPAKKDEAAGASPLGADTAEQTKGGHRLNRQADPTRTVEQNTIASFSIYKPTGYAVVKIVSAHSGEVIGEFPPTKVLDALTYLDDPAKALDEQV